MLELRNVDVSVGKRKLLSNINLTVGLKELHVVIGPNGSGKTSLLNAVMGLKPYEVVKGQVFFMNSDVTQEPPYVKARKGIILAYQLPPAIKGVMTERFVEELIRRFNADRRYVEVLSEVLEVKNLFSRYLFDKMSGGERKRLETFLTLLTNPKVAMLDEPDSGVDIESLNNMSEALKIALNRGSSIILVTHSLHMLRLLREQISAVHMLYGGTMMYSGIYDEVVPLIERHGFSGALTQLIAR
ncbi:MAG: ATP-binding cassette domain-containing protein [Zestosphaera sp.]